MADFSSNLLESSSKKMTIEEYKTFWEIPRFSSYWSSSDRKNWMWLSAEILIAASIEEIEFGDTFKVAVSNFPSNLY